MTTSWGPSTSRWRGFARLWRRCPGGTSNASDRLSGDAGRPQEVPARRGAAAEDVASGRHDGGGAHPSQTELAASGGPRSPLPGRREFAADGLSGIVEALREHGDRVRIITKTHAAVHGGADGGPLGAAERPLQRHLAGHRRVDSVRHSSWADVACLSMNKKIRFLLLGDFRQLPAVLDGFAGAEVCRELKDSQLVPRALGALALRLGCTSTSPNRCRCPKRCGRPGGASRAPMRSGCRSTSGRTDGSRPPMPWWCSTRLAVRC